VTTVSLYIDDDHEMPRFRVNREAMTDPEVFARERAEIFDEVRLYVGHETGLNKRGDKDTPGGSDESRMPLFWRRWNEMVTGETLPPEPHDALDEIYLAPRRPQGSEPATATP
jgi:hypothetical protein